MTPEASVDPELRSRLAGAERGERVDAVLGLRAGQGATDPAEPAEVEEVVERVLRRVAKETGSDDYEVNVFGYLESFALMAEVKFMREVLRQPEIRSATTNRPAEPGD